MSKRVKRTVEQRQEASRVAMAKAHAKYEEKIAKLQLEADNLEFIDSAKSVVASIRDGQFSEARNTMSQLSEDMPEGNIVTASKAATGDQESVTV